MSAEGWVAISTGALALVTVGLGYATVRLERAWKKGFDDQLGLQSWFHFQARFDSKEMKTCRKTLAAQLEQYTETIHDKIREDVFELFDDLGMVHGLGLINKKLVESAFSFYVNHWWRAAKSYVDRERQLHGDDQTLFEDFERLAKAWQHIDPKIDNEALKKFLADEKRLRVD